MNRDELARHLYIHAHNGELPPPGLRPVDAAYEWDAGLVTDDDMADCYAQADRMIADGEVPA